MVHTFLIASEEPSPRVLFSKCWDHDGDVRRSERESLIAALVAGEVKATGAQRGVTRIPRGLLFETSQVVVWQHEAAAAAPRTACILACGEDENVLCAAHFLRTITSLLNRQRCGGETHDLLPEKMLLLLQKFLPNGQLLFVGEDLARELARD